MKIRQADRGDLMADSLVNTINNRVAKIHQQSNGNGAYYFPDVELSRYRPKYGEFISHISRTSENPPIFTKQSVKVTADDGVDSFRLNVFFEKHDALEHTICDLYTRFIQKRADSLKIFRKCPVNSSTGASPDLSILISRNILSDINGDKIGPFVSNFAQEFEKERTMIKLYVNSKARSVASVFLDEFK